MADVSEAFGEEMSLVGASAVTCIFNAASDSQNALTVILAQQSDQEAYADGIRASCTGPVREVPEAGDDAFACSGGSGAQGYVSEGDQGVVLSVGTKNKGAALKRAAALLPSVNAP